MGLGSSHIKEEPSLNCCRVCNPQNWLFLEEFQSGTRGPTVGGAVEESTAEVAHGWQSGKQLRSQGDCSV